ncbi:hypothetical protein BMS3Abin08_00961 [bacterium BMS3Abin08]|nr:hypothetical protein BMS3Abin08_00961 [bacterium BMS3Abin08]
MDKTIATAGVLTIAWAIRFFLFYRKKEYRAAVSSGVQKVITKVQRRYDPDLIVAKAARALGLLFTWEEETFCTEMVIFGAFNMSAKLSPYEEISAALLPEKPRRV